MQSKTPPDHSAWVKRTIAAVRDLDLAALHQADPIINQLGHPPEGLYPLETSQKEGIIQKILDEGGTIVCDDLTRFGQYFVQRLHQMPQTRSRFELASHLQHPDPDKELPVWTYAMQSIIAQSPALGPKSPTIVITNESHTSDAWLKDPQACIIYTRCPSPYDQPERLWHAPSHPNQFWLALTQDYLWVHLAMLECIGEVAIYPHLIAETVSELEKVLSQFFGCTAFSTPTIYSYASVSDFDLHLNQLRYTDEEEAQIRAYLAEGESFYLPEHEIIYLGQLTLSHLAEELTHHLRKQIAGPPRHPHTAVDTFYARAVEEAFGFLGSLYVDPHREHTSDEMLMTLANDSEADPFENHIATWVLEHHRCIDAKDDSIFSTVSDLSLAAFNATSHLVGYRLGAHLYTALTKSTPIPDMVRNIFIERAEHPHESLAQFLILHEFCRDTASHAATP